MELATRSVPVALEALRCVVEGKTAAAHPAARTALSSSTSNCTWGYPREYSLRAGNLGACR